MQKPTHHPLLLQQLQKNHGLGRLDLRNKQPAVDNPLTTDHQTEIKQQTNLLNKPSQSKTNYPHSRVHRQQKKKKPAEGQ